MPKYLIIGAACTVLLGVPGFAMTPAKTAAASHPAATHTVANEKTPAMHHRRHHKLAMNLSTRGNREVRALNTLEAAGYRGFDNLHARGANFIATATKAGKSFELTVTPAGAIQTHRA